MGTNSRARREARRRTTSQGTTRVTARASAVRVDTPGGPSEAEIIGLIDQAAIIVVGAPRIAGPRIARLNEIGAAARIPEPDPAALVVTEVLSRIGRAWENGWQPADLVHATRRRTSRAASQWMARAVLLEGHQSRAMERSPLPWADQLRALGSGREPIAGPAALLALRGTASVDAWIAALLVLDFLHGLPGSQPLMPPPSRWGATRRPAQVAPSMGSQRAKTLTRIRALLAKAESTEFAAEAEAFTGKAQDLMTRYAIDEALLAEESPEPINAQALRVLIHHPYAMEKAGLLDVIARANRARAVWSDFASNVTLVGVSTDVEQVEMLFTSALMQATRAMTKAGQSADSRISDRSSGFRKAFLSAYATRIRERLTASADEAVASYGTDVVPMFERQRVAIDGEFERLFPHATSHSRRRQFDARGWDAGTRAADSAVLPAGAVEG